MVPLLYGASALSSLAGLFGGDDSEKWINKAVEEIIRVKVPDPERQRLELERFRSAGELSPELEEAIAADPSAFEDIVKNTKYSQAQERALSQLQTLGEEGGMSLSDKADLQEQLIANANQDRANRDAITDEFARRGTLGSGMALQAQMAGAQSAGDRDAASRLRVLGNAQDRALESIMGAGELAGNLSDQDYRQQSDLATARDRINAFNTENARDVQSRNVGMRNAAQASNLESKQNLMNANTELGNREQQYNKELIQQQFDNRMRQAEAKANAYTSKAQNASNQAARRSQAFGAVGSGLGQLGSTLQNQANWDKWYETAKSKKAPGVGASDLYDDDDYYRRVT